MPDFDYYDRVLVGIAASLSLGFVVGAATPLALHLGAFLGALGATVFIYAGVFYDPPEPRRSPAVKTAVILWHVMLVLLVAVIIFG